MSNPTEPKLPKWPFFLGDLILIGLAFLIFQQSGRPMDHWQMAFCLAFGALGAGVLICPAVLEYRALCRLTESSALVTAMSQIQKLEQLATQIGQATAQWQGVQEHAGKTAGAAREIAERMGAEVSGFTEFMQKANDGEKSRLRLEVDKLKRGEGEWLQVIVRMLDHTFALNQAALRSAQPGLIEQLSSFQNACRDVARRVGLNAFVPAANEPFDAQRHQLIDPGTRPEGPAQVGEILASGYTFQGQILRPALVKLQAEAPAAKPVAEPEVAVKSSGEVLEEQALL